MTLENLTKLQKVALKGEIAGLLSTCYHNADVKLKIYSILKEIAEEDRTVVFEAISEAVNLSEEELKRISLEASSNTIPVWLWVEKTIADIKEDLVIESPNLFKASAISNKTDERKKIVESAFIRFVRESILVSYTAANKLINAVLEDDELSFLHTSCFYLKDCCRELIEQGYVEDPETAQHLLEIRFDVRDILCYVTETETLEELNKNPIKNRQTFEESVNTPKRNVPRPKVVKTTEIPIQTIRIEGSISPSELSDYLSQKITELFQGDIDLNSHTHTDSNSNVHISKLNPTYNQSAPKEEPKISYVVQKVWINADMKTDIRECDTEEEAEEFIRNIKKERPELQATCDFIIQKKRIK